MEDSDNKDLSPVHKKAAFDGSAWEPVKTFVLVYNQVQQRSHLEQEAQRRAVQVAVQGSCEWRSLKCPHSGPR